MSPSEQAEKNRREYPHLYAALQEVRDVFGEDARLMNGIQKDGKTVGREPWKGFFDNIRRKNGW